MPMVSNTFEIMSFFRVLLSICLRSVVKRLIKRSIISSVLSTNFISFMAFIQKQSHQVNWRLLEFVNKILWRFPLNLLLIMFET